MFPAKTLRSRLPAKILLFSRPSIKELHPSGNRKAPGRRRRRRRRRTYRPMDVSMMELREVHKCNGTPAMCSILWDECGEHLVTTSSASPTISVNKASRLFESARKELCSHTDGVIAPVLSPDFAFIAFCSIDHSVHLCSFPDGVFLRVFTRLGSRSSCLAFNRSGSLLAAAGDDGRIRLMETVNGTMFLVLKDDGGGPVSGLSFDPMNYYLASVDVLGTVAIWSLPSGRQLHRLRAIAPNRVDASFLNILCWSVDGNLLAVSGRNNDVVVLNGGDVFQKMCTLEGDNDGVGVVCYFFSWSPNRWYLATSWSDKQVLIWDVDQRQVIGQRRFEDSVCSLAWKSDGKAVAVIDVMGKVGVWEPAVPCRVHYSANHVSFPSGKKDSFDENMEEDLEQSPNSPRNGGPLASDASSERRALCDLSCDDELDAMDKRMDHGGVRFDYHGPGKLRYMMTCSDSHKLMFVVEEEDTTSSSEED